MRALIASALLLAAGPALACSCIGPRIQRQVLPADGAVGVPIDARVRVHVTGGLPENVRAGLGAAYRLVGPKGPVPLSASLTRTRLDLVPGKPLTPSTTYRLEQLFAYDTDGRRVDDDARLRLALEGGWVATRRWYPVSEFTTGAEASEPPPTPVITKAWARFARGGGDCGPGVGIGATFQGAPGDRVAELVVDGQGVVASAPVHAGENRLYAGNLLCNPDKVFLGKGPFTLRLAFVGPNGARTVSAPAPVKSGGLFSRAGRRLAAPKPEWAALWFKGAIQPSPQNAAKGPASCPAGLEASRPTTLAAKGAPSDYDARNALAWIGGAPRAVVVQDAKVGYVAGGKFSAIHEGATSVKSAPATDGTALALVDHRGEDVSIHATYFDARGTVRWTRRLVGDALNWKPQVAACGAEVVIAWERVIKNDFGGSRIHWARLNAADGQIIGRAKAGFEFEGEGLALGCGGDGAPWLIGKVGHRGALKLVRFLADGPTLPTDLPRNVQSTTSALAPHPQGALLLTDRAAIEATLVSADGRALAGPFLVAQGRKPAIVRQGDHYVAAWEQLRGRAVFATALDAKGTIAEVARIADGWSTVSLGAHQGGAWMLASDRGAVRATQLTCRRQPSSRAPALLP